MNKQTHYTLDEFIHDATVFMPRHQVMYHLHASRHLDYLYVETPKVACSTIKRALQEYEHKRNGTTPPPFAPENIHPRDKSPLLKIDDAAADINKLLSSSVFKWCVVRNPFTRVLSCYLGKIYPRRETPVKRKFFAQIEGVDPSEVNMKRTVSFEEFLELVSGQQSYDMDAHWRVLEDQTLTELIEFDQVCRFENLSDDLAQVSKAVGEPSLLDLKKPSNATGASDLIATWYKDPIAARLVREIYERDFARYGYSTKLPE